MCIPLLTQTEPICYMLFPTQANSRFVHRMYIWDTLHVREYNGEHIVNILGT